MKRYVQVNGNVQSLRISQASAQLNTSEMIPITALQKRGSLVWNMRYV